MFSAEESRVILTCARRYGLIPKIHADEIEPVGGSVLAGELGAISAEHLIVCPPEGIEALAKGGVIACLLPATSFYLGSTYAPARQMVASGVAVAMASDFNPGSCPSANLQFVMNLGCLRYRLTYPQDLGDKEKMREWILRERQIELATEGQRYFDVRRWMIADKDGEGRQNGYAHGMNVRGTINDTEEFNRVVETEKIVFNRKMYLQPIPDHEMRKTQNLVQNPGW